MWQSAEKWVSIVIAYPAETIGHIHNHIIFNNTNLYTGRTFETEEDQGGKNARVWKQLMDVGEVIFAGN